MKMLIYNIPRSWPMLTLFLLLMASGCELLEDSSMPKGDLPQLSFLEGEWLRVDGNNTSGNGMRVNVTNDYAVILDPAQTSLKSGDTKWKTIVPSAANLFEHQELGSDYNYYAASIKIINDDEIEINVVASGAGNFQRWVRASAATGSDKLQGPWTRVESNNPNNDFMQVDVQGDLATIIDKAQSGFNVGDIKWKNISETGSTTFDHEELGSDGNYYPATITLLNDSTLEITVGSSGSGNAQKWVRIASTSIPAVELDCSINTATTLVNGPAAVDYVVSCVVDITAALTIEPGVVIEFEENGGLGIYDNGSINAVGDANNQIIFRSTSGVKGFWRGIHVETNSISNEFDNVIIQDAGSNYVYCCNEPASLLIKSGKFAISNSQLENGAGIGISVRDDAEMRTFSNVVVTTHDEYPMRLSMKRTADLDGMASDFTGNSNPYLQIYNAAMNEATTVPSTNIPYLLDEQVLDITENLTLKAGVELVMGENTGLGVYDDGSLTIEGTASAPVIIRGFEAIAGYWRGIHMETNSLSNDISYAQISEAGSDYVYCCNTAASIFFKNGQASLSHTTISNGRSYGIYAASAFNFETFQENTVTGHQDYPMYIAAERIGELDGMGSSYMGNDKDYVGIINSDVSEYVYWPALDVPYRIESVLDVTDRIDMQAGTELVFEEGAGLGVYDSGILNAVGSSSANIVFRGLRDEQGFWRGIHIETNSSSNILDYVSLRNAGSNYVYCCNDKAALFVKGAKITVSNSFVADSGGCGIYLTSGSDFTESGNTFTNNADGHICE